MQKKTEQPKIVNYLIKFSISAGLLFLIIRSVNIEEALVSLSLMPPGILALALGLQLASTSIASFRWFLIMRRMGSDENILFFLKSYFKGTFFNQGLPTSIGGDGIRILDYSRASGSTLDGFFGVFIDRFAGLAGLLILNICALVLSGDILPPRIRYLLITLLVLLLVALVALLYLRKFRLFTRTRWLGIIGQLSERYYQVYSTPLSVGIQLGLSILIHLCAMTALYLLGIGIDLNYPLAVYLVLVPPVILLTLLPISLAGWGIREGAMVGFFLLIGADRTKVLSFSILYGILVLVHSLPGLWVYLAQKNKL
jgi:uncharacterized membrane protein YbhN (UPF0104 family)